MIRPTDAELCYGQKTDTERSTHIQLKATAKSNERAHLNSVREASLAKKGLKPVVAPSDPEFFRLLTEYGQACMAIEQEVRFYFSPPSLSLHPLTSVLATR